MGSVQSGSVVDSAYNIGIKKPRYAKLPIHSEKEELLNRRIDSAIILISQFVPEGAQIAMKPMKLFSWIFPAKICPSNLTHAAMILMNDDNPDVGILIEYGAYDRRREGDYRTEVHYYQGNGGLRFTEMTIQQFEDLFTDEDVLIPCYIENRMTLSTLIKRTQHSRKGHYHDWSKYEYNIVGQNCQLFVRKAIQVLGATRCRDIQKVRTVSKMIIPERIIGALEENEDNFENIIERIPIFGQFFGIGMALAMDN